MSLRAFLIWMAIGTIVSWLGWLMVLLYVNPFSSGAFGGSLFYLSLFFALLGTFALAGFGIRAGMSRRRVLSDQLSISVRQSSLFSILVVGTLMLQGNQLFTWWSGLLLLAALVTLELFFLSQTSKV